MKKIYIAPEMESIIIHGIQLLADSQESLVWSEEYSIDNPEDIH